MDLGRQRLRVVQGADRYVDIGIFYSAFYAPTKFENVRLTECIEALEQQRNSTPHPKKKHRDNQVHITRSRC